MGNKSPQDVQYSDCKHFSLLSKRCQSCNLTACYNCFGLPLVCSSASIDEVEFKEVCKRCYIKGMKIELGKWWEVLGEDNQKEILFLHGQGYTRKMFRPHALQLVQKGYRCIIIDLPGHGALINQQFSLKNCMRIIEQALSHHCLKIHVLAVGYSLGALALIEYMGSHESAFKKIILLSCCYKLNSIFDAISPVESRVEEARKITMQAKRDSLKASVFLGVLEGGLNPLRYRERRLFAQKLSTLSQLQKNNGYLPILLINGGSQDRQHQQEYFTFAGKNSFLLVYANDDEFYWCDQSRYFSLLNDITYFFNRE